MSLSLIDCSTYQLRPAPPPPELPPPKLEDDDEDQLEDEDDQPELELVLRTRLGMMRSVVSV